MKKLIIFSFYLVLFFSFFSCGSNEKLFVLKDGKYQWVEIPIGHIEEGLIFAYTCPCGNEYVIDKKGSKPFFRKVVHIKGFISKNGKAYLGYKYNTSDERWNYLDVLGNEVNSNQVFYALE